MIPKIRGVSVDNLSCERLISQYYRELYNYILVRLRYNTQSAEDCTQELFMTFFQKHRTLNDSDNIRLWLYRTADNVVMSYRRKNISNTVSLEDSSEAMNTPSFDPPADGGSVLDEYLTPEEIEFVRLYYDSDYGERGKTAQKLGMTVTALYQRIYKIKSKVKKRFDKK